VTLLKGVIIPDDLSSSDLMNENFPYRFSMWSTLRSGHLPLWIREIYGGFPLLARAEAGICYPINIVLFGLLSPYVALNLTILVTLILAGVGMYFYTQAIGASYLACILAGVAFCFSGYLISHLKHLSMANTACWFPLGLALLERAVKRHDRRALLWFGLVFGLQHLAGNAQAVYYCGVFYILYFGCRFLGNERDERPETTGPHRATSLVALMRHRLSWTFVGMLVLGSLLAAVQLIPTYQLLSLSQRSSGVTFEYASSFAYDPKDIWTFLHPYINGDLGNLTYSGKGVFGEDYGYVGLATLLLAITAPVLWWRNWHVRFFAVSAVVSYVLVLGPATPVYKIVFQYVPGMKYLRFPTRLLLVTDASLVVLASLGLTRLARGLGRRAAKSTEKGLGGARRSLAVQASIVAITVGDLLYFQTRQNPVVDLAAWTKTPETVDIIKRDLSLFRIFSVGGNHSHRAMVEQTGGWEGDLQPFVEQRQFIQPSSNVLYGLSSPNGYANLTPNYIVDVWGDQNRAGIVTRTASTQDGTFRPTAAFWKLMRMYNVKYLTSFWPFSPSPYLTSLGVYGGAYLYRNSEVLPRAYLVGDVASATDSSDALRLLNSDDYQPERSVMLDALPANYEASSTGGGTVDFLTYATNEAEMHVHTDRRAILVFADSFYPGWVADVDGRKTPIYRANMAQRAIVVPAGDHNVRFRFVPLTIVVGFWVSLAALVGFCVLGLAWRRRGKGDWVRGDPLTT
jgi:Bacterial membrane protein YfhO